MSAETWPVGHFIKDEMKERGWTRRELVQRLGEPLDVNSLAIALLIDTPRKGMLIGKDLASDLARVFGTSPELWINLDVAWQASVPSSDADSVPDSNENHLVNQVSPKPSPSSLEQKQ